MYLHSTMVLLKFFMNIERDSTNANLHSTMVLLKFVVI